ncbi:unnamed protein product [Mytilus coruscus]|uniref:MULE transposase domain-containing protein n=1 Tax=Mytilus coruscus TaxID=42192 RepID=A0A6J8B165_MYTCO|nr:unnamed protein product [Mytilus coruscus]
MNEIDAESLKFGNETVCQSKTVLQKAVSEGRINTYLHEDTFKELILVRDILAAEDIDNNKIEGYIQHISYDPFQIAMFEETQIKILAHKIKAGNCVLYFDATGTVVEKSGSPAKTVLYFALICKSDVQGDPPIPLAELITSDNTTLSITTFLHKVKYCLVKHFYERSGPQRIETDFSWALIHACLLVFNTEDVTRYGSRSWNIVHHKCSTAVINHFTIMHICASHMIKAAKRQVESKIIDPAHVDFIVRIFALLQNERDFARLTKIWTSFFTVFAGKYLTETVQNSLETLNNMINTIGIEDYIDDTSYEEKNTAELELCEVRQLRPLRLSSPFFDHFLQISSDINCEQTKHTPCSTVNGYFNPRIVELILNSYMYLVPLWTGILLGDTNRYANDMSITVGHKIPDITRDTNASVENWFK